MSDSDRALVLVLALAWMAGFIAAHAWPQRDVNVARPLALFCSLGVAVLALIVLHWRKGRP